MPDRVINSRSATGCLLVLLPAALAMSAIFVAWPYILGGTLLFVGGNVWQNYEWAKTVRSIDPTFQRLVVQNRGEISPIDLSLTGNISGGLAKKYLAAKAEQFGTGSREYPDRGQVYYFMTVSTLGAIFDDSESEDIELPAIAAAVSPVVALPQIQSLVVTAEPVTIPLPEPVVAYQPAAELTNLRQLFDEEPTPIATPIHSESVPVVDDTPPFNVPMVTIIQSELAKRLDVHSSTIYKRRSEPDFTDWTRNRDPEGLGWAYAEVSKEYYRVDV